MGDIEKTSQSVSCTWGAAVISVLIVSGFFILVAAWYLHPSKEDQVLTLLVGTFAAAFMAVVNYWLGSTASSQRKDVTIQSMSTTAQQATSTAAVIANTASKSGRAD